MGIVRSLTSPKPRNTNVFLRFSLRSPNLRDLKATWYTHLLGIPCLWLMDLRRPLGIPTFWVYPVSGPNHQPTHRPTHQPINQPTDNRKNNNQQPTTTNQSTNHPTNQPPSNQYQGSPQPRSKNRSSVGPAGCAEHLNTARPLRALAVLDHPSAIPDTP